MFCNRVGASSGAGKLHLLSLPEMQISFVVNSRLFGVDVDDDGVIDWDFPGTIDEEVV